MKTRLFTAFVLSFVLCAVALPQNENALKSYFEGKKVEARIDMPATNAGVDVDVFSGGARIDYNSYGNRLRQFGMSIRDGDAVVITKVKVKKDTIEIQLNGGGFGTFWDDTRTTVDYTPVTKSKREVDVERRMDEETDPRMYKALQAELNDLRWQRERENSRRQDDARAASTAKADQVAVNRENGGSRFNLHFGQKITGDALFPERIMEALGEWVIFPWQGGARGPGSPGRGAVDGPAQDTRPTGNISQIEKGMSAEDVADILGDPVSQTESLAGGLSVVKRSYRVGSSKVDVDFCEGVVIRFVVTSQ